MNPGPGNPRSQGHPFEPISYLKRKRVHGYQYYRADGRLITVLPYWRHTWVIVFPYPVELTERKRGPRRPRAPHSLGDIPPPKPRAPLSGEPEVPPRREVPRYEPPEPEPEPEPEFEGLREYHFPPPPPEIVSDGEWTFLPDYLKALEQAQREENEDPATMTWDEDDVIRRSAASDNLISIKDGLVWDYPLPDREMSSFGFEFILVVRVWGLLYKSNENAYHVFARARSFRLKNPAYGYDPDAEVIFSESEGSPKSYKRVREIADELFADLVEWADVTHDYGQVKGPMLAWTFWGGFEKAPGGKPRGG